MRRWLALLVVCFVAVVVPTVPGAGKQVKITYWGWGEQHRHLREMMPAFNRLYPDIEVELVNFSFNDTHEKLIVGLASGAVPDVSMVEIARMADLRETDALTNLLRPPFNGNRYKDDFVPSRWQAGLARSGALIALPIDIGPAISFYRRSLMQDIGLPADPETLFEYVGNWDKFLALGRRIAVDTDGDGVPNRFLVPDATQTWGIMRDQTGTGYIAEDGSVPIDSPAWAKALSTALEIRQRRYDALPVVQYLGSTRWKQEVNHGNIAFDMRGVWLGGYLQQTVPDTAGDWGMLPLPEQGGVNQGGSFVVIPAASQHKEEAWKLVQFMFATAESQKTMFTLLDYFPAYMPTWRDPVFDEQVAFYGGQRARRLVREVALRIPPVPVHSLGSKADSIVKDYVAQVLAGAMAPQAALERAAREVRALLPSR